VVEYARQCLRFWVDECHVDGFRFDLASVMGRTPAFARMRRCLRRSVTIRVLSQVKLIAEPWDIGEGGYQVGNFPPLFAEWNDHFRDARAASGCSKRLAGRVCPAFCRVQRSL
jgi:glycogen operon protein